MEGEEEGGVRRKWAPYLSVTCHPVDLLTAVWGELGPHLSCTRSIFLSSTPDFLLCTTLPRPTASLYQPLYRRAQSKTKHISNGILSLRGK